jgi:hypothetical protein
MLERDLEQLGRELDYPATPPIAEAVGRELSHRAAPARRLPTRRVLVLAALATLLLSGAVVAAALEVFDLRGATVERAEKLPAAPDPASPLDLGRELPLSEARRLAGFRVVVPEALGAPDAVYLRRGTPGGEVTLAYHGLGTLVGQFRGDLAREFVGKVAGQATRVERLRVGGARALWIEGAPHLFFYREPGGAIREGSIRLARNVLLLERGRVLVRLEGAFSRQRAVEIAQSLR